MEEVKKLRFGLGFQVETDKGPVDLYSVNSDEDVSGTYVQSSDYDELLRERNELAAQVERLRGAYNSAKTWEDLGDALKETPAQSLEAVKREAALERIDAAMDYASQRFGCYDVAENYGDAILEFLKR